MNAPAKFNDVIARAQDAADFNFIMNHPKVRPWVGGDLSVPIDGTELIKNFRNVCLVCGGFTAIFIWIQPGIYEVHTGAIPEYRGEPTSKAARAMLHFMFGQADAVEIITRVPVNNDAAKALALSVGFQLEFTREAAWPEGDQLIDCEFFSLTVPRWVETDAELPAMGKLFHKELDAAYVRARRTHAAHPADENHDRYAGACFEMVLGGQVGKAVVFYNRWAFLAGYPPIAMMQREPLILDLGESAVRVEHNSLELVGAH